MRGPLVRATRLSEGRSEPERQAAPCRPATRARPETVNRFSQTAPFRAAARPL